MKIANSNLPKSLFKPHVKPYWSRDLNDLKKDAKTWRTWIDNGRPRDPDCPIFKEYKAAKSCYRAGLRRAKHKYNLDSYNDITRLDGNLNYHTRAVTNGDLKVPHPNLSLYKSSLSYSGSTLWSSIPHRIRGSNNLYSFKQLYKDNLGVQLPS